MNEKEYPTLKDVKAMTVPHGKLIAADTHSSSHGMMALSGVSDTLTLKEVNGEFVLLHSHKTDMDGTTEKLYRADAQALQKIADIAERENLYAWGEMRIDPEKDSRPKIYDFSSSSGITLYTDDEYSSAFSFNCDTARFYGAGDVIDEIDDIFSSFITDENFISEKEIPITDPNIIEMKKNYFKMPMGTDPSKQTPLSANLGEWKCPGCNAEGNTGKFCTECGTLRPQPAAEKAEPETKPESEPEQEWTYDGGAWTCPMCNGEGNEGKFCATCGSWRPDLDPDRYKKPEPAPDQPSVIAMKMGIPNGMIDALKAAGAFPQDKYDEQLAAAISKNTPHGRIVSFSHSCWSNGMAMNSHTENKTIAKWEEDGSVNVTSYIQQGVNDATITEYKAGEKIAAELEAFIRENAVTDLAELKYERSRDPFAGMTDTSGGADYGIRFDDSSVGGDSTAYFSVDPAAVSQHGGGELIGKLRDLTQRLCTEGTIISFRREPYRNAFMGMGMGMGMKQIDGEKWKCSECGHDQNGGKFCNNCGSPKK